MTLTVLSGWSGIDDELSGRQLVAIAVVFMALTLLATTRIRAQTWRVTPLITAIVIAFAIASYAVVDASEFAWPALPWATWAGSRSG